MTYLVKKATNHNGQDMMLTPYDVDYAHRTLLLTGPIDEECAMYVSSAMRALARDSDEDIILYIQSPGGSVSAGLSICDTIDAIRPDVVTVACGMTASMGAFLLSAGTRGKRYVQKNAHVLIHQVLGGAQGQATDMKIQIDHILNTRQKLNQMLAENTGQSVEKIEQDTERDKIFDAEAAVAYGLADLVGDPISLW